MHDGAQHVRIELEVAGELVQQLVHTVEPLQEDARTLVVRIISVPVTGATGELVTEATPFFLDQHHESFRRAEVGIQAQLTQCGQLGRAIPTWQRTRRTNIRKYRRERA
jgi:hypothetical protein